MNARGHAIWIVDIALCVSALGALAGQFFGRDSVYAEPGKSSTSGESVVLVFPAANRFDTGPAGLKPGALSDRAPHPVAFLHVKSDSAR
jgi:hypothetical protein